MIWHYKFWNLFTVLHFFLQKFLLIVWHEEFLNLLNKIINLALFVQEFGILLSLKPGNTE